MLEVKHVAFHKGLPNLFVGPCNEHFVIIVGFLCEPCTEEHWHLQIHPFPVSFQEYA